MMSNGPSKSGSQIRLRLSSTKGEPVVGVSVAVGGNVGDGVWVREERGVAWSVVVGLRLGGLVIVISLVGVRVGERVGV